MKKFVFLYVGFEVPTQEIKEAWINWFASIADHIVDSGNPFGPARIVSKDGSRELPLGKESLSGYTIIAAADLAEAERIAQSCPMLGGVRVYEALAM